MTPLTTYTCGIETSALTPLTHTHVASTAKERAVIALCDFNCEYSNTTIIW